MKRIVSVLLTALLICALCVPVFADGYVFVSDSTGDTIADPDALNVKAQSLYDTYGVSFCFLREDVADADAATAAVNAAFIPGRTIPDAPAIVLVDGGENLYTRGINNPEIVFRSGVSDAVFDAYQNETSYTDGILAFFDAAASYIQKDEAQQHDDRFIDNAELVPDASAADALNAKLNEISQRQACDVVILTVDGLGSKTATEYADDYFDYNGFGLGEDRDGILFLISMEERDWAISTRGFGIEAFTDYGQEVIMDAVKPDLSGGDYDDAFNAFADKCDELLTMARNGTPLDRENERSHYTRLVLGPAGIILALVLGFLISGAPMKKLKNEINNVKWKSNAVDYTRPGSMALTQQYDNFLYANTTRTVIETESSSGRSGGSSTHTSSSGATHGGSSGKF